MKTMDFISSNADVLRWCTAALYVCKTGNAEEAGYFFETCKLFSDKEGADEFVGSFSNAGFHMRVSEHGEAMRAQLKTSLSTIFSLMDQRARRWLNQTTNSLQGEKI